MAPSQTEAQAIEAPQLYGIIGHPVAHSLSPTMQNAAFAAAGWNAVYRALDVPPSRLADALAELHLAGYAGLNVTLPHKENIVRLLLAATPEVGIVGAANTLRRSIGGWEGDATDGRGFIAWIQTLGIPAPGARVLVVGSGGAARSVVMSLARSGVAAIKILNRTPGRAVEVALAARALAPGRAEVGVAEPWEKDPARERSRQRWDFLVRAVSSEEVAPEERRWWSALIPGGIILDLNYGKRAEGARSEAMAAGFRYEDGRELLVEQGALSFEFWTGRPAPRGAMRAALVAS